MAKMFKGQNVAWRRLCGKDFLSLDCLRRALPDFTSGA